MRAWQTAAYEEAVEDRKKLMKGSLLRKPKKIQKLSEHHWRYRLVDIWPSTKRWRWNYGPHFKSQSYSGSFTEFIKHIDKKMKASHE